MKISNDFSEVLWDVLQRSQGTEDGLSRILYGLDKETIILFFNEFIRASSNLGQVQPPSDLSNASDDTKREIFDFLVSQGKDVYDEMVTYPERIPVEIDPDDVWVKGITIDVFWDRFHERIPRHYLNPDF